MVARTYVCWAHDAADLFHRVEIGAQPSVHGEDLLVDDCGNGQAIEAVTVLLLAHGLHRHNSARGLPSRRYSRKCLPQLDVVSALAFVVESVDTINRRTFVVTSEDKEVFRVFYLVGQEQADCLEGLLASIYIIAKEEVVRFRRKSAVLEEAQKIVVLAMNIAANLPRIV